MLSMFSQVSVCPRGGGVHPPGRHPPPPNRRPLQWTVRILVECILVTGRNEVVAKVIFLHLFVILFTGGVLPQCMPGYHPHWIRHPPGTRQPLPGSDLPCGTRQTPPQIRPPLEPGRPPWTRQTPPRIRHHSPQDQADPPGTWQTPLGTWQTSPPPGSRLQHTVYERPVRILLECILVLQCFHSHSTADLIEPILHKATNRRRPYFHRPQTKFAKVMFYRCLSVHRVGGMCGIGCMRGRVGAWQGGMHGGGVRGRRDGHCSGQYASYLDAFLLSKLFENHS